MASNEAAENLSAIVWTERHHLANRLIRSDDRTFSREIARRLGQHLGQITPIGRRWSYRLAAMHAHRYTAPRLALVGDAAHLIHPIAGQGLNLGLRDVAVLSALVIDAVSRGKDPGDSLVLARYQRQRRPDNLLMLAATDLLDRLFSNDISGVRSIRDIGLAGAHGLSDLKKMFIRQAMGARKESLSF